MYPFHLLAVIARKRSATPARVRLAPRDAWWAVGAGALAFGGLMTVFWLAARMALV